jgi:hypothetical protein
MYTYQTLSKSPSTTDHVSIRTLKKSAVGKGAAFRFCTQVMETELMKPNDYDAVIREDWFKYAQKYIKPQLGTRGFGTPRALPDWGC